MSHLQKKFRQESLPTIFTPFEVNGEDVILVDAKCATASDKMNQRTTLMADFDPPSKIWQSLLCAGRCTEISVSVQAVCQLQTLSLKGAFSRGVVSCFLSKEHESNVTSSCGVGPPTSRRRCSQHQFQQHWSCEGSLGPTSWASCYFWLVVFSYSWTSLKLGFDISVL